MGVCVNLRYGWWVWILFCHLEITGSLAYNYLNFTEKFGTGNDLPERGDGTERGLAFAGRLDGELVPLLRQQEVRNGAVLDSIAAQVECIHGKHIFGEVVTDGVVDPEFTVDGIF